MVGGDPAKITQVTFLAPSWGKPCASRSRASGCMRAICTRGIFALSYLKRTRSIRANAISNLFFSESTMPSAFWRCRSMAATNFPMDMVTTDTSGMCWLCAARVPLKAEGLVRERLRYWWEERDAVTYVTGQRQAAMPLN